MRPKAWERLERRGFATKIAVDLSRRNPAKPIRPQTVRRWLLPPDHPDRRSVADPQIRRILATHYDLQPNDFDWLPGEKSERRAQQRREREAAER